MDNEQFYELAAEAVRIALAHIEIQSLPPDYEKEKLDSQNYIRMNRLHKEIQIRQLKERT